MRHAQLPEEAREVEKELRKIQKEKDGCVRTQVLPASYCFLLTCFALLLMNRELHKPCGDCARHCLEYSSLGSTSVHAIHLDVRIVNSEELSLLLQNVFISTLHCICWGLSYSTLGSSVEIPALRHWPVELVNIGIVHTAEY